MAEKVDRLTRVNELLKRALAEELGKGFYALSGMLLSVTSVRASVDLRNATVMVSIFGGKAGEQAEVMRRLEAGRVELQKTLARELGFKHTPVLLFKQDRNLEKADEVLAILSEMENRNNE